MLSARRLLDSSVLGAASLGFVLLSAGCSSNNTAVVQSADASIEVMPADTEKVIATSKGGMPDSRSEASTCRSADNTFTFVPSTGELTWRSCSKVGAVDGPDPIWAFVRGERTLTDAEAAPLVGALRALGPSSSSCGADKPTLKIEVTTPRGTATYLDDFYACEKRGTYVEGMDAVFHELDKLTSSSSF